VKVRNKKFRQLSAVAATALAALLAAMPVSAQDALGGSRPSTVLPTDTVPLPLPAERQALGESLKMRLFQRLPSRFYFSSTVESSFRIETNVFQFPSRSALLRKFAPDGLQSLSPEGAQSVQGLLDRSYAEDVVFRVTPNVTAGWALTQNTRVYGNYYFFRDQLFKNNVLSTSINQYALGIEHSRLIPHTKNQYEIQFQARELFQSGTNAVFDYLPSFTLSRPLTKNYNWVAYFNGLLQLRSTKFANLPNRSITPFYTFGLAHTRGRWSFSANATMLNTYQKGFSQARSNIDSGSWICDFEIARQIVDKLPGFQAFVRCEPVFNFAGRNLPGLSGNDVRVFFGLRMSAYKPPLIATINQLKQHYSPQEKQEQKKKKEPDEQPPPPTEEKPKSTDPGTTSMEDPTDDLSLITLNPTPPAEESGVDSNSAGTDSVYPAFTLKPVDVDSIEKITQSIDGDHAKTLELANSLSEQELNAPVESIDSPAQSPVVMPEPELSPTAAPMHGFLDHEVKASNELDTAKISSIPDLLENE
jgi:hypothetical protein